MRCWSTAVAGAAACLAAPALAETPAAGLDVFYASDSDQTEVLKLGANLDWRWNGPEEHQGIRLEKAWFTPVGQRRREMDRVYVRFADELGRWKWNAAVGSDGRTVSGERGDP